ncbi:MAG: lipopolysaccharide biosynthesis protein [Planctomycetota bacterium]
MSKPPKDDPTRSTPERYLQTDHSDADLRKRSVRGGALTVGGQFIRHILIPLAVIAVLARLLTPADFGLLAMVAVFTNFLSRFQDLGLAMAVVQKKEINQAQVSTLFWVNVAAGVTAALLMVAFAPVAVWFYGEPRLGTITVVLAVALVFGGLTVQHRALLRRQMRFTAIVAIQIVSGLLGAIAGISAALLGAGYWSLVVLQLTSTATTTVGMWVACGWRPAKPVRGSDVRELLSFGGNLTAANLLTFLVRNLDNVLIGWRWGADALGFYSKAYELLLLPVRQLTTPLTGVAVPALSRLQDRPEQYVAYYKRGIELLTFVGMPAVVFTFIAAEEIVLLVLGGQWTEVVPIFRMLAPAAFLGTFNVATGWVYVSLGQTRRQLRWAVVGSVTTTIGFVIGLPWGPIGVAAAFSIASLTLRYPGVAYCFRQTPLRVRHLRDALWRPVVASCLGGGMAYGIGVAFRTPLQPALALGVTVGLYLACYILVWVVLPGGRSKLRETRRMLGDLGWSYQDGNGQEL